jgi:hypothetical protein
MKNISQYSRNPGPDLNLGCLEYETGVFTTRPRRSILIEKYIAVHSTQLFTDIL